MNGMSHMKYMLLGGAGLFGVLVLLGLPLQSALFLAVALACPLMMVFMMSGHSGHDRDDARHGTHEERQDHEARSPGSDDPRRH